MSSFGDEARSQQEHELPALQQLPTGATDARHTGLAAGSMEQHPGVCQARGLPEGEEDRQEREVQVEDNPSSASAAEFMQPKSKTSVKPSQFVKATAVKSKAACKPAFRLPDFSSDPRILEEDTMEEDEEGQEMGRSSRLVRRTSAWRPWRLKCSHRIVIYAIKYDSAPASLHAEADLEMKPWRMRTELAPTDWPNSGVLICPRCNSQEMVQHTLRWRSQAPGVDLFVNGMQHEPLLFQLQEHCVRMGRFNIDNLGQ